MSEGVKPIASWWQRKSVIQVGIFVGAIVLAIAIPFVQAPLCTPTEPLGDNTSYRITIDRPANSDDRAVSENPAINEFSFGPSVDRRVGKIDRTEASYYAPKQEEDWGRQYWCDIKASDYFLVLFTLLLAVSTFFLWRETERLAEGADDQSKKMVDAIAATNGVAKATSEVATAMLKAATAMGENATHTEALAVAAAKSAATAEKALNVLEGPIIRPHGMFFNHNQTAGSVSFTFKNFGRSASTIRNVSATILITHANIPTEIRGRVIQPVMYEETIAPTETSEIISIDDDILRQYGENIDSAINDLHLMLDWNWDDLLGQRLRYSQRFIWSPKRKKFLGGLQLWDDPKRFPPGKTR